MQQCNNTMYRAAMTITPRGAATFAPLGVILSIPSKCLAFFLTDQCTQITNLDFQVDKKILEIRCQNWEISGVTFVTSAGF